jgi:hypothetical protein
MADALVNFCCWSSVWRHGKQQSAGLGDFSSASAPLNCQSQGLGL